MRVSFSKCESVMTRIVSHASTYARRNLRASTNVSIYSFKLNPKTNSEILRPDAARYGWCEKTNGYLLLTNDVDLLSTQKRWKTEMSSRNRLHGDLFIVILNRAKSKKRKRAYLYSLSVGNTYFITQKKTVSPRTSRTKRPRNTYTHYNISSIMHSSQTDFKCIRRYKNIYIHTYI